MSSWEETSQRSRDYSESTAQEIDREVRRLGRRCLPTEPKRSYPDNRAKLEVIAKALLEFETLDAAHIKEIIDNGSAKEPAAEGKGATAPSAAARRCSSRASRADQTGTSSRRRSPRRRPRLAVRR